MKNYYYLFMVFVFLCLSNTAQAQMQNSGITSPQHIDGLSIFPNPASNGKVFIISKSNLPKTIEIYNVLGKKVLSETLFGKALDISKLTPSVYILKIKEQNVSATRKLVVK